jgi:hypothetical protein
MGDAMALPASLFKTFIVSGISLAMVCPVPVKAIMLQASGSGHVGAVNVVAMATLPPGNAAQIVTTLPVEGVVVDATLVGGLSGIDYDPQTGEWVVISDDPSLNAPARYYRLDLDYDSDGIEEIDITSVRTLLQENGEPYPNARTGGNVPDLESIRFDPQSDALWYASEGSHAAGIDPFVAMTEPDGHLTASHTPPMMTMSPGNEQGPRENLALEGLCFSADGETLWVAMEGPLYQDGEPSTIETTSVSRLTHIDRGGAVLAQYAYEIDSLPEMALGSSTIGISEILAVSGDSFLVLERASFEYPVPITYRVRIYEASIAGAADISSIASLRGASFTPASKRLVLDLGASGLDGVGNVEGITWGPDFENGNRSLVLVSDNNFRDAYPTQVIVLEVDS